MILSCLSGPKYCNFSVCCLCFNNLLYYDIGKNSVGLISKIKLGWFLHKKSNNLLKIIKCRVIDNTNTKTFGCLYYYFHYQQIIWCQSRTQICKSGVWPIACWEWFETLLWWNMEQQYKSCLSGNILNSFFSQAISTTYIFNYISIFNVTLYIKKVLSILGD